MILRQEYAIAILILFLHLPVFFVQCLVILTPIAQQSIQAPCVIMVSVMIHKVQLIVLQMF